MQFREPDDMKTTQLTRCGVFAAMALIIHIIESYIPPLAPIPGIKVGFANIITLAAIYLLGNKEAFMILIVRIVLGNIFSGQMMSLMYSLSGGLLCYLVTILLKGTFRGKTIWALGVIGAIAHNIGQTVCAFFLFDSKSIVYYGIILCIVSCITGTITGICAQTIVNHMKTENRKRRKK